MLHQQFLPTYKSYLRSAHKRLGKKFVATRTQAQHVQDEERKVRIRKNVAALKLWGLSTNGKDAGFAELLQTLAGVVNEVSLLAEEGGRVERAVAEFERWIQWIDDIWTRRDAKDVRAEAEFIDGLGDNWKADTAALVRRLGGLKRVVELVPPAKTGSSFELVVAGFGQLMETMLEELGLLIKIESMIVEREKKWVDDRIDVMAEEIGLATPAG
jgi:hypothetical protein